MQSWLAVQYAKCSSEVCAVSTTQLVLDRMDLSSCKPGLWHLHLSIPLGLLTQKPVCRNKSLKSIRKPSQCNFPSRYICLQEQVTQEYQKAISKQLSFTLHLFRGRPTSASTRRLVIAHFKAAATEHINSKTPLVGVPGSVAWSNGKAGHLYFVTVQQHEEPDVR